MNGVDRMKHDGARSQFYRSPIVENVVQFSSESDDAFSVRPARAMEMTARTRALQDAKRPDPAGSSILLEHGRRPNSSTKSVTFDFPCEVQRGEVIEKTLHTFSDATKVQQLFRQQQRQL